MPSRSETLIAHDTAVNNDCIFELTMVSCSYSIFELRMVLESDPDHACSTWRVGKGRAGATTQIDGPAGSSQPISLFKEFQTVKGASGSAPAVAHPTKRSHLSTFCPIKSTATLT